MKNIKIKFVAFILIALFFGTLATVRAEDEIVVISDETASILPAAEAPLTPPADIKPPATPPLIGESETAALSSPSSPSQTEKTSTDEDEPENNSLTNFPLLSALAADEASEPVPVNFRIETATESIFDSEVDISACTTPKNSTPTQNGFCLFESAGLEVDADWFSWGVLINSIKNASDPDNFWLWFLNGDAAQVGIDSYILEEDDTILWTLGIQPLKVAVSATTPHVGDEVTVTVKGFDTNAFDFIPIEGAVLSGLSAATDENGQAIIPITSADPIHFTVSAPGFLSSQDTVITPEETPEEILTETFIVRNGDSVLYNGTIPLGEGTISVTDSNNVSHDINAQSVLGMLKAVDDISDAFSISKIEYYAPGTFGPSETFYLKCITLQNGTELCDNWQYAVGSLTPFSSIDATLLSGGETIGIYFGNSHQLVLSTNTITSGDSLLATAQKYDYESGNWSPLTGVSIGVTLPNPENQWNPIVVSTHPVDSLGQATINIATPNTYTVGIVEDFYFPSYTVIVSPPEGNGSTNGPTEGGDTGQNITFSVPDAVSYLKSVQGGDGSFGSALYTDWTAIAYGAANVSGSLRRSLLEYFTSHNSISSNLFDNMRRAMALLALGENPYEFNGVNYIEAITDEFDGEQFGDDNLVNDDIFALFPLERAGFTKNDDMVKKTLSFIVSEQRPDGSWEGSVDVTGAAIQALAPFKSVGGVSGSLGRAEDYLIAEQDNNGGWGNISSTSWAVQAESALDASWTKDGKSGIDYLAARQLSANNGGAVLPQTETLQNVIWNTSYAITAALQMTWKDIMEEVSRPEEEKTDEGKEDAPQAETTETDEVSVPETPEILLKSDAPVELNTVPEALKTDKKLASSPAAKGSLKVVEDMPENGEQEEIEETKKEVNSSMLTAAPVNAISDSAFPQSLPIILGTASGIILLYAAFKLYLVQ